MKKRYIRFRLAKTHCATDHRFYPCEEQEAYTVVVPDLPGCVSQGSSLAEAIEMAIDAASGWVLDELEQGKPLPKASPLSTFVTKEPGEIISVIMLDMDSYAEKYGDKAVRKNVTIPAWMNTFAEKNHVNFSSVLQEALSKQLKIN